MSHDRWRSRSWQWILLGGLMLLAQAGCRPLHEMTRQKSLQADEAVHTAAAESTDEVRDIKSPEKAPFFKPSRLSGALSNEGREIERDLGIR